MKKSPPPHFLLIGVRALIPEVWSCLEDEGALYNRTLADIEPCSLLARIIHEPTKPAPNPSIERH